jgi:hypothetical protein
MNRALSVRTETLPALASLPPMSGSLRYYVGGDAVIDGDLHPVHGTPGPRDIDEARRALPQAEHQCRPATIGVIAAWCRKLSPHLPKAPIADDAVMLAVQGIAMACGDLPYAVWTGETAAEALRVLEWWPTPAKVLELLAPHARRYRRIRDGLARVVAAGAQPAQPPHKPEDPTPEAVAYVAAAVATVVGERTFSQGLPSERLKVRPGAMSDGTLLATYQRIVENGQRDGAGGAEKLAANAAAIRVRLIKEKMVWADPGADA